ncbi:hypothetical protein PCCS19_07070 [Paenibacillus sp. CCS19]|uniref:DUF6171 family protein n=1 Tax=Paenibacillus sp. CCS19 TaxID=3158387 RepID=UPI0025648208|nr:DUF6171 family protein [Paenibacillus cellulosilyticus]GMK37653.1 hypothetical protein PCCS19_07070 [Paenibacillus cellulosilyticus]
MNRTTGDSGCKGCREEYKVTDAQIERLLASPMFSSPELCVSDEAYAARLAACSTCPKLVNGITCQACGCIIPVVAKLKQRRCPLPGGGLWQAIV